MSPLRLQAFPGNLYSSWLGREADPPTGACPPKPRRRWVSALRETHDNVGEADRGLMCFADRCHQMWIGRNNPALSRGAMPASPQKPRRHPRKCIVLSIIDLHRPRASNKGKSGAVPGLPRRLARDLLFPFSMGISPLCGIPHNMAHSRCSTEFRSINGWLSLNPLEHDYE